MIAKLAARLTARTPKRFLPVPAPAVARVDPSGDERVTICTRADAAVILGSEDAVRDAVAAGHLLELPAVCMPATFRELFAGIALVSTTGVGVASHGGGVVHLTQPDGGTSRVSATLYEVLRRSITGAVDLPTVIDRVVRKDAGRADVVIAEIVTHLRGLLDGGSVVLARATGRTAGILLKERQLAGV